MARRFDCLMRSTHHLSQLADALKKRGVSPVSD